MLSFPFALTEVTKTSLTPLRESGEALKTGRPMGKCTIVLWEAPLPSQPSKHTGPNHSLCPGVGTPTPVSCRSRFFSVGSREVFNSLSSSSFSHGPCPLFFLDNVKLVPLCFAQSLLCSWEALLHLSSFEPCLMTSQANRSLFWAVRALCTHRQLDLELCISSCLCLPTFPGVWDCVPSISAPSPWHSTLTAHTLERSGYESEPGNITDLSRSPGSAIYLLWTTLSPSFPICTRMRSFCLIGWLW